MIVYTLTLNVHASVCLNGRTTFSAIAQGKRREYSTITVFNVLLSVR